MSLNAAFFLDPAERSRFDELLRPVGRWFPASTARRWWLALVAMGEADWSAGDHGRRLTATVSAALQRRAGDLDPWSRAFGLVTVVTAERASRQNCEGLGPEWVGGETDLLGPIAALADRLYAAEAAGAPAGPLAFLWLTQGVRLHPYIIDRCSEPVRRYARVLAGSAPPPPLPAPPAPVTRLRRLADHARRLRRRTAPVSAATPASAPDRVLAYLARVSPRPAAARGPAEPETQS